MDSPDEALRRAHELFLNDVTDERDSELASLLPQLVDAGYVEEEDYGPDYALWNFTAAGVKRGEELGCL
jgi:hypothetical protein